MMSGPIRRGLPCLGHLRVQTRGGHRDVLLSDRSVPDAPVAVVDWRRAPLAEVFFEAREGDEYELSLGRQHLSGIVLGRAILTVERGTLRGIITDDVALQRTDGEWHEVAPRRPSLVRRPAAARSLRPSPMVVTLDPHQRRVTEHGKGRTVLILGDAGYGKTTVALHRALRLLPPKGVRALGTLIIVPTEGLRRLTELALERFEAHGIEVFTFEAWARAQARRVFDGLPKRTSTGTSALVSALKRHPALFEAIETVARGSAAMEALDDTQPDGPARRVDLLHLFGDRALLQTVVDAAPERLTARAIQETLSHTRLQFSRTTEDRLAHVDEARLKALDGRRLDEGTPTEDADSIDPEDFAVLFAITRARTGRDRGPGGTLRKYDHVVLDEAQELAPIELSLIGRAVARGGSLTVAGDENQRIDPTSTFRGWPDALAMLGADDPITEHLRESYRCPAGVEALARAVVGAPASVPAAAPDASVARTRCDHDCHRVALLCDVLLELIGDDRTATVAVILRTAAAARGLHAELARGLPVHLALAGELRFSPGIQVTCVDEVRGLEFDYVVIPDANPSSYPEGEGAGPLYVALTRARAQVWLLTTTAWSPLLPEPAP